MIESQSFCAHVQVSPARSQSARPRSMSKPACVVDEVEGRKGTLGRHPDDLLRGPGPKGAEREDGGEGKGLHGQCFLVGKGLHLLSRGHNGHPAASGCKWATPPAVAQPCGTPAGPWRWPP